MRTSDTGYGQNYWNTYDGGAGYEDGPLWEDLAHIIKEMWGYDEFGNDISGDINVLDIGCAKGFLVKHLRRRNFDAWGVDISLYAIKAAENAYRGFLREWDVTSESPPQQDWGSFARVVCLETLEHVFYPERALKNTVDMLEEGGQALLAICVKENEGWDTDPTHVSIYPRDWWAERISELGLVRDYLTEAWLGEFAFWSAHNGIFVVRREHPAKMPCFSLTPAD